MDRQYYGVTAPSFSHLYFFTSLFSIDYVEEHDSFFVIHYFYYCGVLFCFFTYAVLKITYSIMCVLFPVKYPEVRQG